jgi:hypothetical protein
MHRKNLKNVLIYNSFEHPERTNATLERVYEVLDNVLGKEANQIKTQLKESLANTELWEQLTDKQAAVVVDIIDQAELSRDNLEDIIRQLSYSEISTAEAIQMHQDFKIPVSRLEQDIVPVKGQGCSCNRFSRRRCDCRRPSRPSDYSHRRRPIKPALSPIF